MDDEAKQQVLQQELEFFMQLIRINPKSYSMWNHRRWCLSVMSKPDWQQEFKLVGKMLDLDARNCKLLSMLQIITQYRETLLMGSTSH